MTASCGARKLVSTFVVYEHTTNTPHPPRPPLFLIPPHPAGKRVPALQTRYRIVVILLVGDLFARWIGQPPRDRSTRCWAKGRRGMGLPEVNIKEEIFQNLSRSARTMHPLFLSLFINQP